MYHNWVGSMLVSGGYDMQVNVWSMSNYQLKNSYKVSIKTVINVRFYIIYNNIITVTGTRSMDQGCQIWRE